jgi:carbon-monoxide dehydrogenase large subunit
MNNSKFVSFELMSNPGDTGCPDPDVTPCIAFTMNRTGHSQIGQAEPRREDQKLLRGDGQYAADVRPENTLHIVFARSTMPRSRIVECDIDGALDMDGVAAVFTGKDLQDLGAPSVAPLLDLTGNIDFPILAHESVAAVGQAIAAVVATSVNCGLDALDALLVDLDEEEEPDVNGAEFVGSWSEGDVDARFQEADHIVEVRVQHPRLAPSPMEPRAVTVEFKSETRTATVWLSTQTPHRARTELSKILGVDKELIRVIAPDVGGAFGMGCHAQ